MELFNYLKKIYMYLTMKALCFIERALKYIIIHISISISTCKVLE